MNATPALDELRRILSWNHLGKITVRYENTVGYVIANEGNFNFIKRSGLGTCSVKIEFTDASFHKAISRLENFLVSHAALSDNAYILSDSNLLSVTL